MELDIPFDDKFFTISTAFVALALASIKAADY
ncbi:MAG: hypothetical protein ACI901_001541 [Octadecabacter sp.]|jgi:hypothetical protein